MSAEQYLRTEANHRDEPTSEDTPRELTLDEAFKLLRNERRRAVLRRLGEEPKTTLSDLTEHVAAAEAGTDPDQLGSTERKRVYISLYQSHLPRLADAGVIAYDRNRGTVKRLPAADQLDRQLDRIHARSLDSTSTPGRYAGIGVGLAVVAGAVGVPPFGAVDPMWWTVVGALALGALAVIRLDFERPFGRS